MNLHYQPGMRVIKTGIAVFLGAMLLHWWHYFNAFYACIASIICMQSDVGTTFRSGLSRVKGTVVGVCLAVLLSLGRNALLPYVDLTPLFAMVGVIGTLTICNILDIKSSCSISGVAFLSVLLVERAFTPVVFGMIRIFETVVGISIAIFVNQMLDVIPFFQTRREKKLEKDHEVGE